MERDSGEKGYVNPLMVMNLSSRGHFSLVDGESKGVMEVIQQSAKTKLLIQ